MMRSYSYQSNSDFPVGDIFSDDSPVQFLREYSQFYQQYYNNEIKILYSEYINAYIPLRLFKVKLFHFGQLLHAPIRDNKELNAEEQQLFFEELTEYLKNEQIVERLIQPHPSGILKAVPQGAQSCKFGTYINSLDKINEEELLSAFDIKYRKAVNHAVKNGAVVKFGWDHFNDFYKLYNNTTSRAGIYCDPEDYFKTMRDCLGDAHMEVGVIYDNDQAIGALLMLYTRYAALCTHAGSGGESKLYGGMKLLHYETMKRMKQKGVRLYDLVGVRINSENEALEGIFRFKRGFGGELKEGYLWKMDISIMRSRVYDMMMKLRNPKDGKIRDIIDEEGN